MCLCVQFAAVIYSKDPQAPKNDLRASTSLLINTSIMKVQQLINTWILVTSSDRNMFFKENLLNLGNTTALLNFGLDSVLVYTHSCLDMSLHSNHRAPSNFQLVPRPHEKGLVNKVEFLELINKN